MMLLSSHPLFLKAIGMTKRPFFSIITTTYNRAGLLVRALDSLMAQTEIDWEAIVVNDGSTDETHQIVWSYLKKDSRMKYVFQPNQGFIRGKNTGIGLARGRYLTFLDSDDAYAPTHLSTRKTILEEDPELDLLHGGVRIIGPEFVPDANDPGKNIHLSECAISGTFFIKKAAMEALERFKGNALTTDADFMIRAIKKELKIVKVDIPTYIYHRDVESSVTLDLLRNNENKIQP